MVYNFFDKKTKGSRIVNNKENIQLADKLQKPIIRKFKKRKVYSGFKDNIWGVDLADMQLLSKFNKWFRFLLCVIDIYSRYAWVIPLKDKKGESIVTGFQKILKDSNRKPNKIWVDKRGKFYNNSFKQGLKDNDIEMYSTKNKGKSVLPERFIRTLKTKIYKYMTSISTNLYIDKLDDIVKECNNKYHASIKMKPADVKDSTYIGFKKEINDKDPKFKMGDNVRISKCKNILLKDIYRIGQKIFLLLVKLKILYHGHVINDLNSEEIIVLFMKKNYRLQINKNLG